MRKYGIDKFNIIEIEECDALIINERESYWINYYNATNDNYGYNIAQGGEGRIIYDRQIISNYWREGYNGLEIREMLGCSEWTLYMALNTLGVSEEERRKRAKMKIPFSVRMQILEQYK